MPNRKPDVAPTKNGKPPQNSPAMTTGRIGGRRPTRHQSGASSTTGGRKRNTPIAIGSSVVVTPWRVITGQADQIATVARARPVPISRSRQVTAGATRAAGSSDGGPGVTSPVTR